MRVEAQQIWLGSFDVGRCSRSSNSKCLQFGAAGQPGSQQRYSGNTHRRLRVGAAGRVTVAHAGGLHLRGHKCYEIDYLVWSTTRSVGASWIGDSRIYDLTNQGRCEVGRRHNSEHGAVDACHPSSRERWRTLFFRRHTHRSRCLCKAIRMKNHVIPSMQVSIAGCVECSIMEYA
jgi:hypothetical protein